MQTYVPNKYNLMDLHKEIDLYDRKIAYCQQFEIFEFESERAATVKKLERKRQSLVKLAMNYSSLGIEHDPRFLPRSLVVGADGQITEASPQAPAAKKEGARG